MVRSIPSTGAKIIKSFQHQHSINDAYPPSELSQVLCLRSLQHMVPWAGLRDPSTGLGTTIDTGRYVQFPLYPSPLPYSTQLLRTAPCVGQAMVRCFSYFQRKCFLFNNVEQLLLFLTTPLTGAIDLFPFALTIVSGAVGMPWVLRLAATEQGASNDRSLWSISPYAHKSSLCHPTAFLLGSFWETGLKGVF